jgi:chemotaxis protein MotB
MNLRMNRNGTLGSVLALVCVIASSGCASHKTLKNYQDEIRSLREERTNLKKENRDLRGQLEGYEVALADANTRVNVPASKDYPGLDEQGIDYGQKDGNFFISVPAEVTFDSGKAEVTKKGKEALRAVASVLTSDHAGGDFWIEGHTDDDPIKKSKWGSNRELSVARAMAVLHFLVEECGVPDEQCVVAGHGQYEPRAANADKSSKAQNRRVEIVVHKG